MSIQVTPIPRLTVLTAPAFTLGLASAAGSADTAVASDSTLLVYDTTIPTTISTATVAAVTGSAVTSARRDHGHGSTAVAAASGVAKAWCVLAADGTLNSGAYNVPSRTDLGTGSTTLTWGTDFADTLYSCFSNMMATSQGDLLMCFSVFATGSVRHTIYNTAESSDQGAASIVAFGAQ